MLAQIKAPLDLKTSRLTAIWALSGRFEAIWSDQLLAAAVIEPLALESLPARRWQSRARLELGSRRL